MNDPPKPQIYPRYCFHLAPTVNSWCFLRARDVHALDQHAGFEGENFFFYKNLPIKWVRLVGVIVAVDEFAGRRVYTLDDSSGACIECITPLPSESEESSKQDQTAELSNKTASATATPPAGYAGVRVGSVVDVKGGVSTFRDERQITIEKVTILRGTTQEVALWAKRTRFRREVLEKPWVLRDRDIRRCRKEAEHNEGKAEVKRRRLQALMDGQAAKESANSAADESKRRRSSDKERSGSTKQSLDLRQILQHGGSGKYDALGL